MTSKRTQPAHAPASDDSIVFSAPKNNHVDHQTASNTKSKRTGADHTSKITVRTQRPVNRKSKDEGGNITAVATLKKLRQAAQEEGGKAYCKIGPTPKCAYGTVHHDTYSFTLWLQRTPQSAQKPDTARSVSPCCDYTQTHFLNRS
jgi:hypothetical protein